MLKNIWFYAFKPKTWIKWDESKNLPDKIRSYYRVNFDDNCI